MYTITYIDYYDPQRWREIEKQIAYERKIVRSHKHERSGPKERKYRNKKVNIMSNIH